MLFEYTFIKIMSTSMSVKCQQNTSQIPAIYQDNATKITA